MVLVEVVLVADVFPEVVPPGENWRSLALYRSIKLHEVPRIGEDLYVEKSILSQIRGVTWFVNRKPRITAMMYGKANLKDMAMLKKTRWKSSK